MALGDLYQTYDPITYDPTEGAYTGASTSALGGSIIPQLGMGRQFSVGAQQAMPTYFANPYARAAVESVYQPMLGAYLATTPGATGASGSFADYVNQNLANQTAAGAAGYGITDAAFGGSPANINWGNIATAARGQGPGSTTAQQEAYAELPTYYTGLFEGENAIRNANAIAALATRGQGAPAFGPRADIRQAGIDRLQQAWTMQNPAGTAVDWLGYIMGNQAVTGGGQNPYYTAI
ncbi:hypothetical protein CMI37_05580 [Candidatus Pacearchaeota archaeon]|nr:hypothetical protein [Candidatus Pacearchaeota archaeon]